MYMLNENLNVKKPTIQMIGIRTTKIQEDKGIEKD